jgi:hypothetical protein
MKLYRFYVVMIIVLLSLTSGLVLAQDVPAMAPPTVPLNACAEDDSVIQACDVIATQPEDIAGIWTIYFGAEPAFIRYNLDGTWVIADTAENTASALVAGYASGIYSFDDEGLFSSSSPELDPPLPEGCEVGQYILHVIKVGEQPVALNHAVREDCFGPRRTDWAYTLLWVSAE